MLLLSLLDFQLLDIDFRVNHMNVTILHQNYEIKILIDHISISYLILHPPQALNDT